MSVLNSKINMQHVPVQKEPESIRRPVAPQIFDQINNDSNENMHDIAGHEKGETDLSVINESENDKANIHAQENDYRSSNNNNNENNHTTKRIISNDNKNVPESIKSLSDNQES